MQLINVQQGSPEWHELRAKHFNASEAPAMMGVSKYMSRDELLKQKATGIIPEVDPQLQKLFDKGHAAEAAIRPHVEKIINEDLFPATGTMEVDGLKLLASFDGITMAEDMAFEHKLWNEKLAAEVRKGNIDPMYAFQMEQQLLVSGAEKAIFVVSDGTPDNMVYCTYHSDEKTRKALIAGWKQFAEDLANYEHVETKPEAVGKAPDQLPALHIEVTGMVTNSNLDKFKEHALAVFEGINTDLQTDDDFASAEKTVKWCKEVETKLEAAKEHALGQTASIDELFRAIDSIKEQARQTRLDLDKAVKKRKETIRIEIVSEASNALQDHIVSLNRRLGKPYMPPVSEDFAGVIKGKKTVASLQSACNDELARAKIAANEIADKIQINLTTLREKAEDYKQLFPDTAQIVLKENDDLVALITARIAEHKEAEAARVEREKAAEEAKTAEQKQQAEPASEPVVESKPAPAQQAEPKKEASAPAKSRPTDDEIIGALATHFRVHESKVIEWLLDVDLNAASEQLKVAI